MISKSGLVIHGGEVLVSGMILFVCTVINPGVFGDNREGKVGHVDKRKIESLSVNDLFSKLPMGIYKVIGPVALGRSYNHQESDVGKVFFSEKLVVSNCCSIEYTSSQFQTVLVPLSDYEAMVDVEHIDKILVVYARYYAELNRHIRRLSRLTMLEVARHRDPRGTLALWNSSDPSNQQKLYNLHHKSAHHDMPRIKHIMQVKLHSQIPGICMLYRECKNRHQEKINVLAQSLSTIDQYTSQLTANLLSEVERLVDRHNQVHTLYAKPTVVLLQSLLFRSGVLAFFKAKREGHSGIVKKEKKGWNLVAIFNWFFKNEVSPFFALEDIRINLPSVETELADFNSARIGGGASIVPSRVNAVVKRPPSNPRLDRVDGNINDAQDKMMQAALAQSMVVNRPRRINDAQDKIMQAALARSMQESNSDSEQEVQEWQSLERECDKDSWDLV